MVPSDVPAKGMEFPDPFDLERMPETPFLESNDWDPSPPRPRPGEKFLKGPIPWAWIERASLLSGKALALGLVIWREAGCRKAREVPLNLSNAGIPRRTAQRALQELEKAGLVSVEHRIGRPALVTLKRSPNPQSDGQ